MYILIIITIILDALLSYFIPAYFNNLNFLFPMLTLTLIVFLYGKIKDKNFFKVVFLTGFIYDILFSYIFLFHSLIFLMFAKILKKINKYISYNLITNLIMVILFIFLYDLILFLLIYITRYNVVTFKDLVYKFSHSLILNLSFYLLLTIIFKSKKFIK